MDKFRLIVNSGVKRSGEGFRKGNVEFILIGNYFLWYRKLMVLDSETTKEHQIQKCKGARQFNQARTIGCQQSYPKTLLFYRSKCISFRRKSIKKYFNGITEYGITTNKNVWNLIKLFLINKGHLNHHDLLIFDDNKIITN